MKLENLKRSIMLSDGEDISIYLAFCLIDSIFKDVKAESGMKLEECPIGDERQLPAAISRFCRTLKRIYVNNSERMQQFQAALEKQLAASEELCQRFDDIAALAEKAEESRAERSALETEFESAMLKKAEFERNIEECSRIRKELEELKQFDPESAEKELCDLKKELQELSARRICLKEQTAEICGEKSQLEAENEELQKLAGETSDEIRKLESGIEKARMLLDSKKQERDSLKASIERLKIDISELSDENKTMSAEVAGLQTESDDLRLERERLIAGESAVKSRISEAACAVAALQLSISNLEDDVKKKCEKGALLRAKESSLISEKKKVSDEVERLSQSVEALSAEVGNIQSELIPRQQELLSRLQEEHAALSGRLAEIQADSDHIAGEIVALEEEKRNAGETLDSQENTKKSLTEALALNNEKIRRLDEQLNELRGKNDKERQVKMKNQLQAEIDELKNAQRDCLRLDEEIKQTTIELQNVQAERQRREEAKNKLDESLAQAQTIVRRLCEASDEDIRDTLNDYVEKINFLKGVSEQLECTAGNLAEILALPYADEEVSAAKNLKKTISALGARAEELWNSLEKCAEVCADKIHLEVR